MKKSLRSKNLASKFHFLIAFCLSLTSISAFANTELDRKFALETVGYLKSWDDVDGLFADYVTEAYKDYFSKQSRFVLQDLSKIESIFDKSKLSYRKIIEDKDILAQLAKVSRAESIVRTRIKKTGNSYNFTVDWLHSPKMEVMATDQFGIYEPKGGQAFGMQEIKATLHQSLDRLIKKVPYLATVTGRDNNSVTVNIGENVKLKKGDQLVVSTLDDVKRHPLLNAVVEWQLTRTGKVEIDEVDEMMAFGHVIDEEEGRTIARYQKIVQIIPKQKADIPTVITEKEEIENKLSVPPAIGWVSGGLMVGSMSRQYSQPAAGKTGGGIFFGAKVDSQIWLTREWFGEVGLNYGFWGQNQTDIGTSNPNVDAGGGSLTTWRISGGYSYLITGDLFGPKGWAKIGYRSSAYSLPVSVTNLTVPIAFKSLLLSIGGEFPIRDRWGAVINLDFGLLPSASQLTGSGFASPTGATDVTFHVGGYYRLESRITLRLMIDVISHSADLSDGSNVSQKSVSVVPALLYYF
jgi:hypothetical protein